MNVVWQPQPKQYEMLCRGEDEGLYGGAAGGGKSDYLVAEALRQVKVPNYKGIILRKTFPQLIEIMEKCFKLYPRAYPGAKFNDSKHVWTFPSGAKIYFGHMSNFKAKYNYQGLQFDFVGIDELTHFMWDEYDYMRSRNRRKRPEYKKLYPRYGKPRRSRPRMGQVLLYRRSLAAAHVLEKAADCQSGRKENYEMEQQRVCTEQNF